MAAGDWGAGATIRPTVINVTVDDQGQVSHVGIGYDVIAPSGFAVHRAGLTWHSPHAGVKQAPATVKSLQAVIDKVIAGALQAEGLTPSDKQ